MKRRYYLIDTENVGDRWIDLIPDLEGGDILVVFYTKNHSKLLGECYLKQRYNKQIRWVECVVGYNALDQQLTGVLSYLIATHGEAGYAIYSNDKGYNSVIDFWKQRGLDIDMVGFDTEKKKDKDSEHDKGGKDTEVSRSLRFPCLWQGWAGRLRSRRIRMHIWSVFTGCLIS